MRYSPPSLLVGASNSLQNLSQTKQLHAVLIAAGVSSFCTLWARLLRSYAALGDVSSARLLFDETPHRTVLLWNSIIRAHARRGDFSCALSLFFQMRCSGAKPDNFTFACVLRANAENSDSFGAKAIHGSIISSGFASDAITSTQLVSAYSKLGLLQDAYHVFDGMSERDLVCWNAMMMGCAYAGSARKGLELFHGLRYSGEKPDSYTLVSLLSCLWGTELVHIGEGIHGLCLKYGYESHRHVKSVLVSMYSRCGSLTSAHQLCRTSPDKLDLVTWSALITGFSNAGEYKEAIGLSRHMLRVMTGRADSILVACMLSACASLASIRPCKEIHCFAIRVSIDRDITFSCALIDAYAKCGFPSSGLRVFEAMQEKTLVAFNTMISCMASHGLGTDAIQIFELLLEEGIKPDNATFSALLCACCHSGLEKQGINLFRRMHDEFGVKAEMEHYVYMVKLLGMLGQLQEAYGLILTMPMVPDCGVWGALLWGCSVHGNRELGEVAAQKLFEMEPRKTAYRIMLSNIYAAEERWGDVKDLRSGIGEAGLLKIPGLSWIGNCNL